MPDCLFVDGPMDRTRQHLADAPAVYRFAALDCDRPPYVPGGPPAASFAEVTYSLLRVGPTPAGTLIYVWDNPHRLAMAGVPGD